MLAILKKVDAESRRPPPKFQFDIKIQLHAACVSRLSFRFLWLWLKLNDSLKFAELEAEPWRRSLMQYSEFDLCSIWKSKFGGLPVVPSEFFCWVLNFAPHILIIAENMSGYLKYRNLYQIPFPCCKYSQNAMSLICDPYIHISGYFLRCLTKRGRKCLKNEVNLHISS